MNYTLCGPVEAIDCTLCDASSTFFIEVFGSNTQNYTATSTATVTESLVSISRNNRNNSYG